MTDLDWQDDDSSMYEADRLDADMAFLACVAAALMAILPLAFCLAAARAKGWL